MNHWREYLTTLIIAVVCALIVRFFVLTAYKVPTGSMQPTLVPGDFIFASRVNYGIQIPFLKTNLFSAGPERGDIVVFKYEPEGVNYLKRVIGLPGDVIEIREGKLVVNDESAKYSESKTEGMINPDSANFKVLLETIENLSWNVLVSKTPSDKNFGPLVVPPGEIFMLGDNRDVSDDSRYWGTVPVSNIKGKAWIIWFSFGKDNLDKGQKVRVQRILSLVK